MDKKLNRLPPAFQRQRTSGTFHDHGFLHIDIKHRPTLKTVNGKRREQYLYVAISRYSRSVHLAIQQDELTGSAFAFRKAGIDAAPFRITHVLTYSSSCFMAEAFEEACRKPKVQHRRTWPYTPQTNGMVERFNGRIEREVTGITVHSHVDLETLLKSFNQVHRRRWRGLDTAFPEPVVLTALGPQARACRPTLEIARSGYSSSSAAHHRRHR